MFNFLKFRYFPEFNLANSYNLYTPMENVREQKNSEVCHPRCAFKLYGEVNSVKKHNYKYV